MIKCLLILVVGVLAHDTILASEATVISETECQRLSDVPQTRPAPADLNEVQRDLLALRDQKNRQVLTEISPAFLASLKDLFERDPQKISKLEQFFALLHLIGTHKALPDRRIDFEPQSVRKVLSSSRVFSTPDVPSAITAVTLYWSKSWKRATYVVTFDKPEVRVPLNGGRGFATFKEGLCQIAQFLVFLGGFEFDVEQTRKGHVYVSEFKNVDIEGIFGARGVVDVDINLISIKSVEFLSGSPFGIVRAKVSRREFEINEHSKLLQLVTNFVTDKSTQPIDW